MLDGAPDRKADLQNQGDSYRNGWMQLLESTVCTLKTLITLPPQLIFNYALKVLQQTGQPILDILVRKVYRVNILAGPLHL